MRLFDAVCFHLSVNFPHWHMEILTCMDTCQGQECGVAGSPFTIRDTTAGGMAGFPHVLGQSGKANTHMYRVSREMICLCTVQATQTNLCLCK